jgi:hypothetical protein
MHYSSFIPFYGLWKSYSVSKDLKALSLKIEKTGFLKAGPDQFRRINFDTVEKIQKLGPLVIKFLEARNYQKIDQCLSYLSAVLALFLAASIITWSALTPLYALAGRIALYFIPTTTKVISLNMIALISLIYPAVKIFHIFKNRSAIKKIENEKSKISSSIDFQISIF